MRDWVKLWRPASGSHFEVEVSGPSRMLFRGLLVYLSDEDGDMLLPKHKAAHQALGMAIGYTSNERRSLKAQLAELTSDGCIVVEQTELGFWRLTMPRFVEWQSSKKRPPRRSQVASNDAVDSGSGPPLITKTPSVTSRIPDSGSHSSRATTQVPEIIESRFTDKRRKEEKRGEESAGPRKTPPEVPDRWAQPTSGHGIWMLLQAACHRAGIPFGATCWPNDDAVRQAIFDQVGGPALVEDFDAFARHLISLSTEKRDQVQPWRAYRKLAGRWVRNAPKATKARKSEQREQLLRLMHSRRETVDFAETVEASDVTLEDLESWQRANKCHADDEVADADRRHAEWLAEQAGMGVSRVA